MPSKKGSLTDYETDTDRSIHASAHAPSRPKSPIPERVFSILRGRKRGERGDASRRSSFFFSKDADLKIEKENANPNARDSPTPSPTSTVTIATLTSQLESLKSENGTMKEELEKEKSTSLQKEEWRKELERMRAEREQRDKEIEEMNRKLEDAERERKETNERLQKELDDLEKLRGELEAEHATNVAAQAEAESARQLAAEASSQAAQDRAARVAAETAQAAAEGAKEAAEQQAAAAKKKQSELQRKMIEQLQAREEAERVREAAEKDADAQADLARDESREKEKAVQAWRMAVQEVDDVSKALDDVRRELDEVREERQAQLASWEEEKEALVTQVERVKVEALDARLEVDALREKLELAEVGLMESKQKLDPISSVLAEAEANAKEKEYELALLKAQVESEARAKIIANEKLRDAEMRVQELMVATRESKDAEEKTRSQLRTIIAQNISSRSRTTSTSSNAPSLPPNGVGSPRSSTPVPAPTFPTPTAKDYDALRKVRKFKEGFLHFAVVGAAGCGKSSLINAFRGVLNATSTAAPTGLQTELTTTTIGRYPDPRRDARVIWFDVPGSGSPSTSGSGLEYFHKQGLYVFDAICLLWDNRLTATDISVLESCVRLKIPAFLIRTKSDVHLADVEDVMRAKIEADIGASTSGTEAQIAKRKAARLNAVPTEALSKFITQTRQSVDMSLRKARLPQFKVYMVSSKAVLKVVQSGGNTPDGVRSIDERDLIVDIGNQRKMRR